MRARFWMLTAVVVLACGQAFGGLFLDDFEAAEKKAAAEGKFLLVRFTGSDWCRVCQLLDKEVFSKHEFATYAKDNLICVEVDFPREKLQTKSMKERAAGLKSRFGVRGFPTVLVLKPQAEEVLRTGYRRGGVVPYVAFLEATLAKHRRALKPAAMRTWTDKQGRTIEAEVYGRDGETVRLRTPEGKIITVFTKNLSDDDLFFLEQE